ncbi:ATP-dependent RNA helicase DDX51 [Channa argus]|uniref:ATP-dependent RNA helicase n=1 Tax=Channa argus TaxID=215402 RepID=A0A6G1QJ89_CHAAH|nr:ATP-dependent RNA helicase DDX51 [Channa argus]
MSLFLVNRYLGEEEDGSISKESHSQLLLTKLQQKAKQKQNQALTEQTVQHEAGKKRKADKDISEDPPQNKKRNFEGEKHEEPMKEKKKKVANEKKKKKDQSGSPAEGLSDTPGTEEDKEEETENDTLQPTSSKTSAPAGFTVLGRFENKPVQKVHRIMPQWLAQPDMIHSDIKSNLVPISDIPGLSSQLVKKLQNNGIHHFFPVQAEVIPAILECTQQGLLIGRGGYKPRDICVSAPTGSGKTLAFVLPVIQIIDEADRMVDSMHQSWLNQVVKAVYRSGSGPEAVSIFRRTEPVYITAASLSQPQMPLQKLLFSATLTQNPEKLQQLALHQPRLFSSIHSLSETSSTPADPTQKQDRFDFPQGLTEYYVPCTLSKKPLLILHFILRMKLNPILCFTNSKETAHRLFLLVQLFGGVHAAEFSSRLSPGERKKTLKEFKQGKIQLLISTDAAARGIDIDGVKCVVNYDAPQYIRTYIHRSTGKTPDCSPAYEHCKVIYKDSVNNGFCWLSQEKNFIQMVVEAGSPGIQKQIIKPENLKSLEARYQNTLQELANVIKEEKAK